MRHRPTASTATRWRASGPTSRTRPVGTRRSTRARAQAVPTRRCPRPGTATADTRGRRTPRPRSRTSGPARRSPPRAPAPGPDRVAERRALSRRTSTTSGLARRAERSNGPGDHPGAVARPGPPRGSTRTRGRRAGPRPHSRYRDGLVDASPVDRNVGAFSDRAPWIIDPDALDVAARPRRRARPSSCRRPRMLEKGRVPPLGRMARTVWSVGLALGALVRARPADRSLALGTVGPAPAVVRAARLDLREARPDRVGRRGPVPRGARRRVQVAPRPRPGRAVRRHPRGRRGRSRRPAVRDLRALRLRPDRGGVDRAGPRGAPAHRRGRRREGAAPAGRPARGRRHPGDVVAGAAARRSHPRRRRSRTHRRSSSSSPRRSPRSSTSASKPRT